jgi:phosphoribosyl 1,2-cyclic phosphodiesterase
MRFASLGSGSRGNALLVEAGGRRVMLDCGFKFAEAVMRLQRLGCAAEDIDAIVVTHEHDDHIGGVARFASRVGIPVYMTPGTRAAVAARFDDVDCRPFAPHAPFRLGALTIDPFPVPHDAREPAQFVFDDGCHRLGVLTDVGMPTAHIRGMLCGCSALVLECNYDQRLLRDGPYPPSLKARIGSRFGHLRNDDAAELLASIDRSRLRHVVGAHLSETNNHPELVREILGAALGSSAAQVSIAQQDLGFDWLSVD